MVTDKRNTPAPTLPASEAELFDAYFAEVTKSVKKPTAVHRTKAEKMVKADVERIRLATLARDPEAEVYDDPVWNSLHPLHGRVNALIEQGMTPWDAEAQARAEGVEGAAQAEQDAAAEVEDLVEWLAKETWSDFAVSLAEQYRKRGSLSPKQIAAGQSMREKVEAKRQAKAKAETEAKADGLDISSLPSGYYAVPEGETRLKVRVSRGRKGGNWEGTIFVSDGAAYGQRTNYGMQRPGQAYRGQIREQLKAIIADPEEAMKAYGRLTGTCGACGRHLEDAESIAAGMGPYCRSKGLFG